jgi:hypothetical protein
VVDPRRVVVKDASPSIGGEIRERFRYEAIGLHRRRRGSGGHACRMREVRLVEDVGVTDLRDRGIQLRAALEP